MVEKRTSAVLLSPSFAAGASAAREPLRVTLAFDDSLKDHLLVAAPELERLGLPADIVIASNGGAPLDQNVYQCVKGMTAAEATCNPGGVIIDCVECADGHGGESFSTGLCATALRRTNFTRGSSRRRRIPSPTGARAG